MRPRPVQIVVGLLALALVLGACSTERQAQPVADERPATSQPVEVPDPVETTAPPSPSPVPSPPSASPTPPPAPSYDVAAVQRQLTEQKYYVGAIDGKPGPAMRSAVMAFQKVNGLSADGVVGPATLAALAAPKAPALKASSPRNRVEVDLSKQVLYVVENGALTRILPVSSGNGETYRQKNGSKARALTPVGWFTIQRRIVGVRNADLGTLYDPQYFYRGWAIHGSNSVPAYPASHGCVRVTRADAKWLLDEINVGWSVYLYGGKHTFTAGSSAPGTDNPTGDTGSTPSPTPTQPAPSTPTSPPPSSPPATPSHTPTSPPPASPTGSPTSSPDDSQGASAGDSASGSPS